MSDDPQLYDVRKSMKCFNVSLSPVSAELLLPGHKADRFFNRSQLLILRDRDNFATYDHFVRYLTLRDSKFPWHPELWLKSDGTIPTRRWFTGRMRKHFSSDISGHSLRAGGASALAAAGVSDDHIRLLGRWSLDAYQLYLRQHPYIFIHNSS